MNFKKTLSIILVIALMAGTLLMTACGSGESETGSSSQVRIAMQPSAAFIPLFIARENGWIEEALKDTGVEVVWNDFESGPPINESMAAGSSDIACLGDVPTVSALAAGQDNIIFASACEAPDSYQMLVRTDSDIKDPSDLKGKKVGTVIGSTGHILTEKVLKTAGLDLADVEIVNIAMGDAQTVLENKEVDAVAGWEPNNTKLLNTGNVRTLAKGSDCGLLGENTLMARTEYAQNNPEVIKTIVEQYARGAKAVAELDQETLETVSAALTIDPELFYDVASSYDYVVTMSEAADKSLQETIEFLVKIDVISESFDITEYFDHEYTENL